MEKSFLRKITSLTVLAVLFVLAYFLLKPILMSIVGGIILALIFVPIFNKTNKLFKNKDVSATLVCTGLILLILIPIWFLTPVVLNQSVKIYLASQKLDLVTPMKTLFPSLFQNEIFSNEVGSVLYSFVTNITNGIMNWISKLLLNFPAIFLQLFVVLLTFYFVMRDNEKFLEYIKSLLPFPNEVEEKLFKSSRDLTYSIIYGQVLIGILQGIFMGIGFFIFGLNNALFLTLVACIAAIFPMVGLLVMWVPTAIYLYITGAVWPAIGITLFGIVTWCFEHILKPMFISKRTNVHSGIILIGMLGGIFIFGIMGIILGPLILAYLLIILEIYRDKRSPGYLIQNPEEEELDIKMGDF